MILRNSVHSEIIRVCMGIFTICYRKHKYFKILNKQYLILLPWCLTCCLCPYFPDLWRFLRVLAPSDFHSHASSSLEKVICHFHGDLLSKLYVGVLAVVGLDTNIIRTFFDIFRKTCRIFKKTLDRKNAIKHIKAIVPHLKQKLFKTTTRKNTMKTKLNI